MKKDNGYLYLDNGIVVDGDGEIVEDAGRSDVLSYIARVRHDAYVQEKAWEAYRHRLDAVLMRKQRERRASYEDLVVNVTSRRYRETDAKAFADMLYDAEVTREEWAGVVAAAQRFKRELVPEAVRDMFDDVSAQLETRPWVETSVARRAAPGTK